MLAEILYSFILLECVFWLYHTVVENSGHCFIKPIPICQLTEETNDGHGVAHYWLFLNDLNSRLRHEHEHTKMIFVAMVVFLKHFVQGFLRKQVFYVRSKDCLYIIPGCH